MMPSTAVEHPGCILHCLATPSRTSCRPGGGRAAEPSDPDLERYPGPVRRPLEQHRDVAPRERPFPPGARLDAMSHLQHAAELAGVQVSDVEEVAATKTGHSRDHDAPTKED